MAPIGQLFSDTHTLIYRSFLWPVLGSSVYTDHWRVVAIGRLQHGQLACSGRSKLVREMANCHRGQVSRQLICLCGAMCVCALLLNR